jgi:hypothetical protein
VIPRREHASAPNVEARMRIERSGPVAGPAFRLKLTSRPAAERGARSGKLAEFDGLRGVAALVVVIWYFIYVFMPQRIGIVPSFDPDAARARRCGWPSFPHRL